MRDPAPPEPLIFVVLGTTSDLMQRKLLPALSHLQSAGHIAAGSVVLGVARNAQLNDDGFRTWARRALTDSGAPVDELARWPDAALHYHSIGKGKLDDYEALATRVAALEKEHELSRNRVIYLGLPPRAFHSSITGLGEAGLNEAPGWTRLVVEKPFGDDLASSRALNDLVHQYFDESQVYRIDHYLGKETVQNLLAFRFANPIFESLWNRHQIDSVQITVAEELGVDNRSGFYDDTGAVRDMVQSHLIQLLALIGMEVPGAAEPDAVRNEKVKVLRAVKPIKPDDVVFGQYGPGTIGGGEVPGYLEAEGVPPGSSTETYAAVRLKIDNWRWKGVNFYMRTGKRMPRKLTQIVVTFRRPPVSIFRTAGLEKMQSNKLMITLQPDEGFALLFQVKAPGEGYNLETFPLHFHYQDAFGPLPDAYETLVQAVLQGDQTLFLRADEVDTAWQICTPVLERDVPVHPYPAGSWGPAEADELLARGGRQWYNP